MVFYAIATDGGITAAALNLGVSKSTASTSLARLEAEMGLKLIQRSTRRLRLTDAARRPDFDFHPPSQAALTHQI